jgi:hypothetical protein
MKRLESRGTIREDEGDQRDREGTISVNNMGGDID